MKCFPAADTGWRVKVDQENHPLSEYEFDVLIGADGKRNTLQGETLYNMLIRAIVWWYLCYILKTSNPCQVSGI